MTTAQVRDKYLKFFQNRGHARVPSSSLVPKDDPTTLFTGSGMQPLLPYFLGKDHPLGTRIVNSQKCFRAQDIDEVGDNRHTTFFEMLGNWSFGDYFKEEQLNWIYEFMIKEIGLDPNRLYATVFGGYDNIPRDDEAVGILTNIFHRYGVKAKTVDNAEKQGMQNGRIFYYGVNKNWWSRVGAPDNMPAGEPGGPTSEIFYDFGITRNLHANSPFANQPCHVNCDCGRFLEIGNSVFMTYEKQKNGSLQELPNKNIDFGGGLERMVAAALDTPDIFEIDSFASLIKTIEETTGQKYPSENKPPMRIIADHLKGATFLTADSVRPSNKDQGYYLRRLLRRAATQFYVLTGKLAPIEEIKQVSQQVIEFYGDRYFPLAEAPQLRTVLSEIISGEMSRFNWALERGLKEIQKTDPQKIDGEFAFDLYQSYGLPFEVTQEVLQKQGHSVSQQMFDEAYEKHRKISRAGAKKKFRSGLADESDETVKLHTATHLLHQALREVLGDHVKQKGSNITAKRLRFDFSYPQALNEEEIKAVEELVNQKIRQDLSVTCKEMPYQQAVKEGARALFGEKYPEVVTVYFVGDPASSAGQVFSKEVCTGPHVQSTGELGKFKITQEQSSGKGVRRIRAILETNATASHP